MNSSVGSGFFNPQLNKPQSTNTSLINLKNHLSSNNISQVQFSPTNNIHNSEKNKKCKKMIRVQNKDNKSVDYKLLLKSFCPSKYNLSKYKYTKI
jgi:hypothetical protein